MAVSSLGVMTTLWKRPELARLVLEHLWQVRETLAGELRLEVVAVGSEGDASREVCDGLEVEYVESANDPLNEKHNAGYLRARELGVDAVMRLDSDTLASETFFRALAARLREGSVGCLDIYFLDLATMQLYYNPPYSLLNQRLYNLLKGGWRRVGEPVGPGRCHPAAVLDELGWEPWGRGDLPNIRHRIDAAELSRLRRHGHVLRGFQLAELGGCLIDVKTPQNLNPFDPARADRLLHPQGPRLGLRRKLRPAPGTLLAEHFGDAILARLRELRAVLYGA
jgi:hypothetical protein